MSDKKTIRSALEYIAEQLNDQKTISTALAKIMLEHILSMPNDTTLESEIVFKE